MIEGICSKLPGSIQPPPPPTLEKSLTVQFPRRMYCYTAARHFIGACKLKPSVWGLVGTGSARRRNAGIDRSGHGRDTAEGGQLGLMHIFPHPLSPRPCGLVGSRRRPQTLQATFPSSPAQTPQTPPINSAHLRTFPNRCRPFCETPGAEFVFGCNLLFPPPPLPPPPPNPSPSWLKLWLFARTVSFGFRRWCQLAGAPHRTLTRVSQSGCSDPLGGALGPGGPPHE